MKLPDIIHVLNEVQLPDPTIQKIEAKLRELLAQEKEDARAATKTKHQFVIVVCDKDKQFAGLENVGGFVVQLDEGDDPSQLLTKLSTAVKSYNTTSRKGRKLPIKSIGECFESLPRKFTKPIGVNVKTRGVTRIVMTDNSLVA
jgi:hypothetical protein